MNMPKVFSFIMPPFVILQHFQVHIHPEPLPRLAGPTSSHLFTFFVPADDTKRSHSTISAFLDLKEVPIDSLIRRSIERAIRRTLRDLPHLFERVLQHAEPSIKTTVFLEVFHTEAI